LASGYKVIMELLHQIFLPWHVALDMFLVGIGTYTYLRIKQTKENK
tara:strand:- start:449 stop:586 length:138 start_codon:yes stop_codon:yes gene_type:complete